MQMFGGALHSEKMSLVEEPLRVYELGVQLFSSQAGIGTASNGSEAICS